MFQRIVFRLTCSWMLTVGGVPLIAQQFSADLVHLKPAGALTTKVSVSGDRIRFEALPPQRSAVIIVDLKQTTGFILLPENKTYTAMQRGKILLPMPFFHPADPEKACAAWEKLVNKPGTCTRVGDQMLHGRSVVEYKGTAPNGDTGSAWVDRNQNFVIKWVGELGAAEFQNIKEGTQAASLFEIPKDFERVDPRAPRQRAKAAAPATRKP